MLWMFQRAFLGHTPHDVEHHVTDINARELLAIAPLVILDGWIGYGHGAFLRRSEIANTALLEQTRQAAPGRRPITMPVNFNLPSTAEYLRTLPEIILVLSERYS
jgi:hypothetical protein